MEMDQKGIECLPVVRSFRKVIENRDMNHMTKELYDFLNLYCGFIAHYNINGFRETYASPREFTDVFIRHFDQNHRYCSNVYHCDEEPYKETGFTKAEIKREFFKIVDIHKYAIARWSDGVGRDQRYAAYLMLKKEFDPGEKNIHAEERTIL